jgi:hypothetical protein
MTLVSVLLFLLLSALFVGFPVVAYYSFGAGFECGYQSGVEERERLS